MRNIRTLAVFLAVTAGLVSGCSGTPDSGTSASTAPSTNPGSSSSSAAGSATPSPDTETSVAAPAPATSRPSAGPGQGNAELAITVVPAQGAAEVDYTLVCSSGTPAAESSHPNAAAACAAIKANPDILAPSKPSGSQACTQQYGGPQVAVVTGTFRGRSVHSTFTRTDGCEIARWKAMAPLLGGTAT